MLFNPSEFQGDFLYARVLYIRCMVNTQNIEMKKI